MVLVHDKVKLVNIKLIRHSVNMLQVLGSNWRGTILPSENKGVVLRGD